VSFNIRGSEYNGKHYVNLVAWKLTATGETAQPSQSTGPGRDVPASEAVRRTAPAQAAQPDDEEVDDVPF
jgi:hypothetical protein